MHQQGQGTGIFQMQPPHVTSSLKCPRCDSLNTKFCYYNNYNFSQPRHFCKNCRRYWTKGGVLRNVPVGGGSRKSKRSSSSSKHNKSSSSKPTTVNYSHSSSDTSSAAAAALGGATLFKIPEIDDFVLSSDVFSSEIQGFNNNDDDISVALDQRNNIVSTASFSEFLQCQGVQDWDMEKICGGGHGEEKIAGAIGLLHHTDRIEDLLHNRGSIVGLPTLDCHLSAGPSTNNQGSSFHISHNSSTVDQHHQGYLVQSAVDHHHHDFQWSDSNTSHLPLSFLD